MAAEAFVPKPPGHLLSLWLGWVPEPPGGPSAARALIAETAAALGAPLADIMGSWRTAPIAQARQAIMWTLRTQRHPRRPAAPRWSYAQIAGFLGGLDHTTVIHGVRAHARRLEAAASQAPLRAAPEAAP